MSKDTHDTDNTVTTEQIRITLLDMAKSRGVHKSFCPSEVARKLATEWRPLMHPVRTVAATLCQEGQLMATRGGKVVDMDTVKGPIRLKISVGS